jgi:ethanolamine utilization protein EutA (predicted chaperonin)
MTGPKRAAQRIGEAAHVHGGREVVQRVAGPPGYLTLDLDVAKSLGGILRDELKVSRDIIAVDGIEVGDLDYIDIGEESDGNGFCRAGCLDVRVN